MGRVLEHLEGTLAARPAASSVTAGTQYFATDDSGGTLHKAISGAWVKIGAGVLDTGGRELGYAEITSNVNSITSTTGVDIAGLSITVTVASRPILLSFFARGVVNTTASGGLVVSITNSAVTTTYGSSDYLVNPANYRTSLSLNRRLSLSAGSYTFKARVQVISGTGQIVADANTPCFLQATEL